MPKKVYDITPPGAAKKVKEAVAAVPIESKKKRAPRRKAVAPGAQAAPIVAPQEQAFPWKTTLVGAVLLILIAGGGYLYVTLPKADVTIWPKTEVLSLQEKISADTSLTAIDFDKKIIPARLVEVEQEGVEEFEATGMGSDSKKATGTITIYNNITPTTPFTLKIGTHFLSDSGKYFVTLAKVTIPAMVGKKPGAITVRVEAQDPGPDHNIGASKFSIPKLAGTSYYYTVWGESTGDMTGGTASNFKKVTKENIDNAKDQLTKKLLGQAEQSLRTRVSNGEVLLNGAMNQIVQSATADVKADTTAEKFNQMAKVKVSALVFKQSDVHELAKRDLSAKLPSSKKLLEDTIVAEYDPDVIDMTKGVEKLNLTLSAKSHHVIDTNEVSGLITRKSAAQIQDVVSQAYEGKVDTIGIHFWPFWVHKAPANQNRVKVDLKFE